MSTNPFDIFQNEDLGVDHTPATPMMSVARAQTGEGFVEVCPKCNGSGKFVSYSGRVVGQCFACKGAGKNSYKSSPEARAKGRERAAATKVSREEQIAKDAAAFIAAHPAEIEWLTQAGKRNIERGGTFTFPQDVLNKLWQYGSLTDGQLGAVQRLMLKDQDRKVRLAVEKAAREAAAPVADTAGVDRLKAAFDAAAAYSAAKGKGVQLRSPKITIGTMVISPAKATSANPGALYVKQKKPSFARSLPGYDGEDSVYLGKIANGRFLASRDCTEDQQKQILAFIADPAEAAKVYGQETGVCCICNATLISKWRLKGIGPICAEKFGW